MIKKARRVFAAVVAVLLVCFTAAPVLSANAATQNSWNFKNSNFKKLGTIKSSTTVDGLGLMATSSKNMKVKAESVTVDGTAIHIVWLFLVQALHHTVQLRYQCQVLIQ